MLKFIDLGFGGGMESLMEIGLSKSAIKMSLAELVLAIEKVHEYGFLHLDIATNNILIDAEGHLLLADFGVAKPFLENRDTK